jgi:ATP-dependent DNA ligase
VELSLTSGCKAYHLLLSGNIGAPIRAIAEALKGCRRRSEAVALDEAGRPSFSALGSSGGHIVYFVFDVMVPSGRDLTSQPLTVRRELLHRDVLPLLSEPIRHSPPLDASLADLIRSVREHGLKGLVAKRLDSAYEPGQRSGAWRKMRLNQAQEFVIGGYTAMARNFDALIFGYYDGDRLIYAGRTRVGFTPASRQQIFRRFDGLQIAEWPFANLPEARAGRWGLWPYRREDEGLPLAKAGAGRSVRVCGVDPGSPPAALAVRCAEGGQESA